MVYYNENDPFAAAWLRDLVLVGAIAEGEVDERSIEDVTPNDLTGYAQCHFFAGIGGWSYALRLARWPDDRPVWTGSCPCQPFSAAGKGGGFADERHLWPAFFHLIRVCQPERVLGEQVANALPWFDLVSGDLEAEGYAVGAAIVGAHSVGAPHIRQRLYWVAHHHHHHRREIERGIWISNGESAQRHDADGCGEADGWLALNGREEREQVGAFAGGRGEGSDSAWLDERLAHGGAGELGHHHHQRLQGRGLPDGGRASERTPWSPSDLVWCRDGKWRPTEPGLLPLAHGVPARVGRLRGYGNAIVPQVAAAFIEACTR